jgi:hypothetical protein
LTRIVAACASAIHFKDRLVADLLPAVRDVLAGKSFVSPSVRH